MNQRKRYAVLGLAILLMGAIRWPIEVRLSRELSEAGLMPPKIEQQTTEKLGQTFTAVSLGGLRTLVASFLNLRAFHFFTEQRWGDVADTYELIVNLAPRTPYYWDTGSWHQAYNAAAYYLYDSEMAPLRRKANWRASVLRGREFLERGMKHLPDNVTLRHRLGNLLSDSHKLSAFGKPSEAYWLAYEAFIAAARMPDALDFSKRFAFYCLARVEGKEAEAMALLEEIEAEGGIQPPTIQALRLILQFQQNPSQPMDQLIDSIFSSRPLAYQILSNQWRRRRDHFPTHGLIEALSFLEAELKIPDSKRTLKQPLPPLMTTDDFFIPVAK